jgi:beta-glucanase (GH16 family)
MKEMSMKQIVPLFVAVLLAGLMSGCASVGRLPPREGLVLWLDASDAATVGRNGGGVVTGWQDKVSGRSGAIRGAPRVMPGALNGRDVVRFGESNRLAAVDFPAWNEAASPISMFVVWRRAPEQASAQKWQRLIECEAEEPRRGFSVTGTMRGSGDAIEPVLYTVSHVTAPPLPFTIGGKNPPANYSFLLGDVAEVLVYNRRFDDADEFHRIEDHLFAKWRCTPDLSSQGWLRPTNALPAVARKRDDLPLHDQSNRGGWVTYAPWSDEFNTGALDTNRWIDHNPGWHGRAPSRYLPRNVTVSNGALGITMSMDAPTEPLDLYKNGTDLYHTYAAASVVSKAARTYGAFEIRARPMKSYATSAWWFIGDSTNEQGQTFSNEIDVFEIGGLVPGDETRCGGNLHVTAGPGVTNHPPLPAGWNAPFRFVDGWHTYGLDWGPDFIRFYLDGTLYRSVRNTDWHTPLRMLFDTEIWKWFPTPLPEHFPSTFDVDYVRAWTRPDWPEPAGLHIKPQGSGITKLLEKERTPAP